jgi:hypothetical protein
MYVDGESQTTLWKGLGGHPPPRVVKVSPFVPRPQGFKVMIIDLLLQPAKAGVDWALTLGQGVGFALGIGLFAGLIEAGPEEVADTTHDGVLESLEASRVDGCHDHTWTQDLRIGKLLPRLFDLRVQEAILGLAKLSISCGAERRPLRAAVGWHLKAPVF